MPRPSHPLAFVVLPPDSAPLKSLRREKSPTAEASFANRCLIIVPSGRLLQVTSACYLNFTTNGYRATLASHLNFGMNGYRVSRYRFPNNSSRMGEDMVLYCGNPIPIDRHPPWQSKHIILPYDLSETHIHSWSREVLEVLSNIFPRVTGISQTGQVLLFELEELPPGPFPLTVGNMPVVVVDLSRGRHSIFPFPRSVLDSRIHIRNDLEGHRTGILSENDLDTLMSDVCTYFRQNIPEVQVVEIILTRENQFIVILADGVDFWASNIRPRLPWSLAKVVISYLTEGAIGYPRTEELRASRIIRQELTAGIIDDTAYKFLRPGVLLRSRQMTDCHCQELMFSSGVLVRNPVNDLLLTIPSLVFENAKLVYQLGSGGPRLVGKAVADVRHADVALLQLEPGVEYVNQTFADPSGNSPSFTHLAGEGADGSESFRFPSHMFLNTPFSGDLEGISVGESWRCLTEPGEESHPAQGEMEFVQYSWLYFGQDGRGGEATATLPDEMRGSVIWDDEGVIHGFFQGQIKDGPLKGLCLSVSARNLVKQGYRLANTNSS